MYAAFVLIQVGTNLCRLIFVTQGVRMLYQTLFLSNKVLLFFLQEVRVV